MYKVYIRVDAIKITTLGGTLGVKFMNELAPMRDV